MQALTMWYYLLKKSSVKFNDSRTKVCLTTCSSVEKCSIILMMASLITSSKHKSKGILNLYLMPHRRLATFKLNRHKNLQHDCKNLHLKNAEIVTLANWQTLDMKCVVRNQKVRRLFSAKGTQIRRWKMSSKHSNWK